MGRHLKILAHCAFSFFVTLGCFVMEMIRFIQEIQALEARRGAFARGQQREYDLQYAVCPYFVPSTDVAAQPAGYGTTPAWHLINAIFLLAMSGGECPKGTWFITNYAYWCVVFSAECGVWYTGVLQMQIATAMLSISAGAMGNFGIAWSRYIFSVSLLIIGFSNLILGMLYGSEIRSWRGQVDSGGGEDGESKKDKVKNAFEVLDAVLATMTASAALGPFYGMRAAFKKSIKQL